MTKIMDEAELKQKLKGIKYEPSKEVDERIAWTLHNIEKNENKFVTDSQMQSKHNLNTLFFSLHQMKMKTLTLITLPLVTVGVLAVLGVLYAYPLIFPSENNLKLTSQQKQEIYKNILANNSQMQVNKSAENFQAAQMNASEGKDGDASTGDVSEPAINSRLVPLPAVDNYINKIIITRTENSKGPRIDACKAIYDRDIPMSDKYESTSYYDDKGNSVSKSADYYGDIKFIYQSDSDVDGSESIEYKGGKFAIKTISKYGSMPKEVPASTELLPISEGSESIVEYEALEPGKEMPVQDQDTDWEARVKEFFGPDADIVGKETIDGKEYYIMEYSYELSCDYSFGMPYMVQQTIDYWNGEKYVQSPDDSSLTKITYWNYIDINDFSIVRTDTFYEKAEEDKLIMTTTTTVESQEGDFEEASKLILEDLDIPIKEYTYDYSDDIAAYDPLAENEKVLEYVSKEGYLVPDLANIDLKMAGIYASGYFDKPNMDDVSQWYMDRDFYPEGEFGDAFYNMSSGFDSYQPEYLSLVDYNFLPLNSNDPNGYAAYTSLNMSIWDKSVEDLEIINRSIYNPVKEKNTEEIQLTVTGEAVPAKLYTFINEYESYVYGTEYNGTAGSVESSESSTARSGVSEKMVVDPYNPDKLEKVNDAGYIIIAESGDYKIVIRDVNYQSTVYPQSLEKVKSNSLQIDTLDKSGKTIIMEQLKNSMIPVDLPVNNELMPRTIEGKPAPESGVSE